MGEGLEAFERGLRACLGLVWSWVLFRHYWGWGLGILIDDLGYLMEEHLVRHMALKQKRREQCSRRLDSSTE